MLSRHAIAAAEQSKGKTGDLNGEVPLVDLVSSCEKSPEVISFRTEAIRALDDKEQTIILKAIAAKPGYQEDRTYIDGARAVCARCEFQSPALARYIGPVKK